MSSEVPNSPYPEQHDVTREFEWSEDDQEGEAELEEALKDSEERRLKAEEKDLEEIEIDNRIFNTSNSMKELQEACKSRGLPISGSKRKLLQKLAVFKRELEDRVRMDIANKLFQERERKPLTLGQPRLPSVKEQELHFVTHLPYAPWCQACVANRAREDRHQAQQEKEDRGKNVIAFDFCYTYTGQEADEKQVVEEREDPVGKVEERQDQYGTCLVAASGETQAVLAVPVPSKGTASLKTVVEELIRFSIENSARDPVIFQADGERSTRQILRTVQQVRKVMGLQTEIRITPKESHASNGLAERAVQSIRRMANTLRNFAEEQAQHAILGNNPMFPWSFKHAAWLINRFRVPEGGSNLTSFELAHGHPYRGKLALFGETVMFKRMIKNKANESFIKGVWVGKHPWNDTHIVLNPSGAHESRTIRRLASEQSFSGFDFHFCRGLPWAYSAQGILMKHAGSAQRYRTPAVEAEVSEQELEDVARKIASGFETPTVGNYGGLSTPGFPVESGLRTPVEKRSNEDADEKDENEKKAMRRSEAEEKEAKRGAVRKKRELRSCRERKEKRRMKR